MLSIYFEIGMSYGVSVLRDIGLLGIFRYLGERCVWQIEEELQVFVKFGDIQGKGKVLVVSRARRC